jgi:hypothetical protein
MMYEVFAEASHTLYQVGPKETPHSGGRNLHFEGSLLWFFFCLSFEGEALFFFFFFFFVRHFFPTLQCFFATGG